MNAISEDEAILLIPDCVIDTSNDDYAFLQESILPFLFPALHEMHSIVDKRGYPEVPTGPIQTNDGFNPIRWLAQNLVRKSKADDRDSRPPYVQRLFEVAHQLRLLRLAREEAARQKREEEEKYAALQLEMQREAAEKEAAKIEAENKLAAEELEKKMRQEDEGVIYKFLASDKERVAKVTNFYDTCRRYVERQDYAADAAAEEAGGGGYGSAAAELDDRLYWEACSCLVNCTVASYAAVTLLMEGRFLYHAVAAGAREEEVPSEVPAAESEAPAEDETETAEAAAAPPPPPPEKIRTAEPVAMSPYGADTSYTLGHDQGVTWPSLFKTRTPLYVADAKYTDGMVFFNGEKKAGTYIAFFYTDDTIFFSGEKMAGVIML